jgi:HSP20 family protein
VEGELMNAATAVAPRRSFRNLIRMDPFELFPNRFNRLFEGLPLSTVTDEHALVAWTPVCDIYETEKAIVVKAELPGVVRENVSISIDNNVLTIHGERRFEEETKRENYYRLERNFGEFLRSFTLPTYIDTAKIVAEFKEGLLEIVLPKREEAKPKQIEIKVK